LTEDVYMTQPTGFLHSQYPDYVCKLQRSLYGLKQAPRAWFTRLSGFLHQLGFLASKADSSLFYLCTATYKFYVLVYVDDIIITCSASPKLSWFLSEIKRVFPVKDLGSLHYFLGIQVTHQPSGLLLTQ
jgi:hypothetical protein